MRSFEYGSIISKRFDSCPGARIGSRVRYRFGGSLGSFSGTPVCCAQTRTRTRSMPLVKKRYDPTLATYCVPPARFIRWGWQGYEYRYESAWLDGEDAFPRIVECMCEQSHANPEDDEHRRRAACDLMLYTATYTGVYAAMMPTLVGAPETPYRGREYGVRRIAACEVLCCSEDRYNGTIRPQVIEVMARVLYGVVNYPQDLEAFLASIRVSA